MTNNALQDQYTLIIQSSSVSLSYFEMLTELT